VLSAIDELLNPICLDSTPIIVQGEGILSILLIFMGVSLPFCQDCKEKNQVNKLR
jgi:hypothetical protein